jgi:hypothetical protein
LVCVNPVSGGAGDEVGDGIAERRAPALSTAGLAVTLAVQK